MGRSPRETIWAAGDGCRIQEVVLQLYLYTCTRSPEHTRKQEAGMIKKTSIIAAALIIFTALVTAAAASMDAPRMSKEELKSRLGDKDVVVIDVRIDSDWAMSGSKIKGAVREEPLQVAAWAGKYPKQKTIVLYCA
jgi:hypothetical protein